MDKRIAFCFASSLVISCGTDITKLGYGHDQPGDGLAEGGEIRHENVRLLGMPVQTWMMVYQYKGSDPATSAKFANQADLTQNGQGMYGNCVDERVSGTWPFAPITGATYIHEAVTPKLTGPGITGSLDIVETTPPNTAGNSTFRKYDFTYGGGAPGDQTGFNASMTTEAMSAPGGEYTLDLGDGQPVMSYFMPDAYDTPLNIGKVMSVDIAAGHDLVLTWTPPPNDYGTGNQHTKRTHFNFTFFADPNNATNPPQFICFPPLDEQGHQMEGTTTVPQAVIDALPPGGLIVNADLQHWMEARDVGESAKRRFDLVSIYCNISLYNKQ